MILFLNHLYVPQCCTAISGLNNAFFHHTRVISWEADQFICYFSFFSPTDYLVEKSKLVSTFLQSAHLQMHTLKLKFFEQQLQWSHTLRREHPMLPKSIKTIFHVATYSYLDVQQKARENGISLVSDTSLLHSCTATDRNSLEADRERGKVNRLYISCWSESVHCTGPFSSRLFH